MTRPSVAELLRNAGGNAAESRALLRHALAVDEAWLIAHDRDDITAAQQEYFAALVARRAAGEPLAYITGAREFFSLEFLVTPAVLIPRPETELLVEFALERIDANRVCNVLDLGTGSGCVAIAIAKHRPRARVAAADSSAAALAVAHENAARHAVKNVEVIESDWFAALVGRRFDLIVANPPYVAAGDPHLREGDLRFEPAGALVAGSDGLDCIRAIIALAPQYLHRGGWLALEHGYDQALRCRELLAGAGIAEIFSRDDLAGIARVSGGRRGA
jgi:release factor glutamine methyltransferase